MKLKVCKPQKSGEQISDEEAGTVNAAADMRSSHGTSSI